MPIKPPSHQRNAIPSTKGWHHPKTNELLISRKHTEDQVAEYLGIKIVEEEVEKITAQLADTPPSAPEIVVEKLDDEIDYENMTKLELEDLARNYDVELDRRQTKQTLIDRVKDLVKSN